MKFVPTSRRYTAIAVFMTALIGVTVTANAQLRDRRTPSTLGNFAVPLRAFSGIGDNRFLSPDIPVRQMPKTRVQIGGPNGSNVQEKVVDATFIETADEVTPYWTDDEQVVYYAGNSGTAATSHYQLSRISASVINNPQQPGAGTAIALTNEALADHMWPVPDRSGGRLAFIKSVDNRSMSDPQKVWHLYTATTPAPGSKIDTKPGGASNLLNLTGDIARFRGKAFANVGRAGWIGATDLVFSGRLEGDANYHLFTVNTVSRKFTQLTDGSGDERNPAVSPDGKLVAFDSTAKPSLAGDVYVGGDLPKTDTIDGNPAIPTALNTPSGRRNIFVMSAATGATVQFTNRYAGAPDSDDIQPAFSSLRSNLFTNTAGNDYYIAFASTRQPDVPGAPTAYSAGANTHDIYVVRVNSAATSSAPTVNVRVEAGPTAGLQSAKQVDTVDPGYIFDDQYPTFSPFINTTRVAFQSNRVGDLNTNNYGSGFRAPAPPTPSNYNDICLATVTDVTAPMLIRYDTSTATGEVVHINPVSTADTRVQPFDPNNSVRMRESGIFPGQTYFFTVRMEDRESGIRSVWMQFKNPNSKYQSIAQGGGGVEHKEYAGAHSAWLSQTDQPSWRATNGTEAVGREFEAQVIGMDRTTYFNHTGDNTTGAYNAGNDDQLAFSGSNNPPLDGTNGRVAAWLKLEPVVDEATGNPIKPADGRGGVLYGAKWKIPAEASDWYIDVIAYDNATNPFRLGTGTSNWIIYDNVWGFSSALPLNPSDYDVLFVSDYTLGQKFFASRPGAKVGGPQNDQPLMFGAESYYTDSDMTRYPSEWNIDPQFASGRQAPPAPGGTDPRYWSIIGPTLVTNGSAGVFGAARYSNGVAVNPGVMHPLGVGSYRDELISFTPVGPEPNGERYALPNTGRYTIWRTLSRGTIPQELLDAYLPYNSPAPADVVAGQTTERSAKVVKRVIVWASPFIGNIFVGGGTLADLKTQERLANYVNAGGSIYVSGMDIGWALAGNGQNNTFYSTVLNARYLADAGAGGSNFVNASGSTVFNTDGWPLKLAYGRFDGTNWVYSPPTTIPIYASTNLDSRRDGSPISNTTAPAAYVDTIAPGAGATLEQTFSNGAGATIRNVYGAGTAYYSSFGYESLGNEWYTFSRTVGSVTRTMITNQGRRAQLMTNYHLSVRTGLISGRIVDDNGSPVADALIRATRNGNATGTANGTALSDASGNFVIQGLLSGAYSLDGYKAGFYTQHATGTSVQAANTTVVSLKLKRANPGQLSNIRKTNPTSATDPEGGVFALDGKTGLGGVQVQARRINADSTLTIASAITSDGTDGRRPGSYLIRDLLIWDLGYEVFVNPATNPELDSAGRPLFNTDGTARTVANPAYRPELSSLVVGKQPQNGVIVGSGTNIINVAPAGATEAWRLRIVEDQTSQLDFKLGGASQTVKGTVLNSTNDKPIAGAFVTAVDETTLQTVAQATTDANGNYTLTTLTTPPSDKLPASTYRITASALDFSTVTFNGIVVGGTTTLTLPVFRLTPLAPGSVSGTVRKVTGDALEGGVTIKFYILQNGIAGTTPVATTVTTATLSSTGTYTYNYKVPALSQGSYQVIAEKTGLTTEPATLPTLTVTSGKERTDYNFRMQPAKIYADGIQLISTPGLYDYTAITTRGIFGLAAAGDNDGDGVAGTASDLAVYNQFNIADWTGTSYNVGPNVPIQVGKGYFVNFKAVASVTQVGTPLPGDTFTLTLAPGWNLVGHPFINPQSISAPAPDLDINIYGEIQDGLATPISMSEAVRQGKVRGVLFGYTGSTNGAQYFQTTVMKPWFGYWFRNLSNQPLKLILHYPTSRAVRVGSKSLSRAQLEAAPSLVADSKSVVDYRIQIVAKQGKLLDSYNTVGVAPDAKDGFDNRYDTQKPPMLSEAPAVYVAVEGENESGRATAFADMIRAATPGMKSWTFTVESTNEGDVALLWPNSNRLPRGIDPVLIDTETGKRTAIRSASAYRFAARSHVPHRFRIEVAPAKSRPLALTSVRVAPNGTRAGGAVSYRISFVSTQEANVQVEIQSFAGRTIRQLETRAAGVGETAVVWDGRNTQGALLPTGPYVMVLTAKDDTGATTRQMVPFVSVR